MIYDKEKHSTKMKYPSKNDFIKRYVYDEGGCVFSGESINDLVVWIINNNQITSCVHKGNVLYWIKENTNYVIQNILDEDAFKEYKDLYSNDIIAYHAIYMDDLFEDSDTSDKQLFHLCYSKAYDIGHSSGFHEVEIYLEEMIDFANDILGLYTQA